MNSRTTEHHGFGLTTGSLYVSPYHLAGQFRRFTGRTIHAYRLASAAGADRVYIIST